MLQDPRPELTVTDLPLPVLQGKFRRLCSHNLKFRQPDCPRGGPMAGAKLGWKKTKQNKTGVGEGKEISQNEGKMPKFRKE